jgi:hypothetical protein
MGGGAHERPRSALSVSSDRERSKHLVALKSRQKRGGSGRLRCGGEDRLLVGPQHAKPGRQILRMIRARLVSNAKISADLVAEAFTDLPIEVG